MPEALFPLHVHPVLPEYHRHLNNYRDFRPSLPPTDLNVGRYLAVPYRTHEAHLRHRSWIRTLMLQERPSLSCAAYFQLLCRCLAAPHTL